VMKVAMRWRAMTFATFALILLSGVLVSGAQTARDCSYLQDPDEFRLDAESRYIDRSATTGKVVRTIYALFATPDATMDATAIPRKNLIDTAIFGRMANAGIQSSPLPPTRSFCEGSRST